MNRDALRYQLDGHGVHFDEKRDGFVVFAESLPSDLVREIGACGGEVAIAETQTDPVFLVSEDGGVER